MKWAYLIVFVILAFSVGAYTTFFDSSSQQTVVLSDSHFDRYHHVYQFVLSDTTIDVSKLSTSNQQALIYSLQQAHITSELSGDTLAVSHTGPMKLVINQGIPSVHAHHGYLVELTAPAINQQADISVMSASSQQQEVFSYLQSMRSEASVMSTPQRQFTHLVNAFVVNSLSQEEKEALINHEYVKTIHQNTPVHALLNNSVPAIGADKLYNLNASSQPCTDDCLNGSQITIAVIDTGVNYTHPAFGSCSSQEFLSGECKKVIGGYDFVNDNNNPLDDNGHGTHVASIAAGQGLHPGVAFDASILAYKALSSVGSGTIADIIASVEQAVIDGADVMVLSLGGPGSPDDLLSQAVNTASQQGVVMVVAAGNSGSSQSAIGTPGSAKEAITIGSGTTSSVDSFSSRGPIFYQGEIILKPDLIAPGSDICAAQSGNVFGSSCGDGFIKLSGTSMAAPHIAGLAAIMLEQNPSHTPSTIKQSLRSAATNTGEWVYDQGAGFANATTSVFSSLLFNDSLVFTGPSDEITNQTILLTNPSSESVSVTITSSNVTTTQGVLFEDILSFNESSFVLDAYESKAVEFSLIDDSYPQALFGHLFIDVDNDLLSVPIFVLEHAVLTLEVEGERYPSYLLHDDNLSTIIYQIQDGNMNNMSFLLSPGNYSVHAISDLVNPSDPLVYPEADQYFLSQRLSVSKGEQVTHSWNVYDANHVVFEARSVLGIPLTLYDYHLTYLVYEQDTYSCSEYSNENTCSEQSHCSWSGFSCQNKAIGFEQFSYGLGDQEMYVSTPPTQVNYSIDLILKYFGGVE